MKIEQKKWTKGLGWQPAAQKPAGAQPQIVFLFGERTLLSDPTRYEEIRAIYPQAHIILASTSGNIQGTSLDDHSIVSTALSFEKGSETKIVKGNIREYNNSHEAGQSLGSRLPAEGLKHVFILSDGQLVNGSELVRGLIQSLPQGVAITGGLAGDSTRFEKTLVGVDNAPAEGEIAAVGFYGPHIRFGFGSIGGWDSFGIERKVTRSSNNVLYELDGKSALDLYKTYLGDQAAKLPSSALLFPLAIRKDQNSTPLVRTILKVDEKDKSMTFAGEIPEGWYAQLMKANFDRLIDGASQAANACHQMLGLDSPDLAILISCVGRRLVLDQRTEEEIESVKDIVGDQTAITGFYSYGEIAPTAPQANCELHNQTMTITTISEK